MDRVEVAQLLAAASARDNRKPSEAAILAWMEDLGDLAYIDAADALREHYRTSTEYLTAAHIRALATGYARTRHEAIERETRRRELEAPARRNRSADVEQMLNALSARLAAGAARQRGVDTSDSHEAALAQARQMHGGRLDTSVLTRRRDGRATPFTGREYPPPATPAVADQVRQYLADGYTPGQAADALFVSIAWCRRAAADRDSLPAPTPIRAHPERTHNQ